MFSGHHYDPGERPEDHDHCEAQSPRGRTEQDDGSSVTTTTDADQLSHFSLGLFGVWTLSGEVRSNRLGFGLTIPRSWRGRRRLSKIECRQPGLRWPDIEILNNGYEKDERPETTKRFIQYLCDKHGFQDQTIRDTFVNGLSAVEVVYRHPPQRGQRGLQFRRTSVIRDHVEYLIQVCADDVSQIDDVFSALVDSFHLL